MTLQHDLTMAATLMDEAAAILETLGPGVLEKLPNWRWPLTDELSGAAGILRDRLASPTGAAPGIDPMQDPMRPTMNRVDGETPAETVLRKLAAWLGVGGYNAPTVDAEAFHRKIVDGVEMLLATAKAAEREAGELTDEQIVARLEAAGVKFQRFMGGPFGTKDCWGTAGTQDVRKLAAGVRAILAARTPRTAS